MNSILNILFNLKHDEFELGSIGSFDTLTFAQLSDKILMLNKGFTVKKENIDVDSFLGVFESPNSKLTIIYCFDGTFISKKEDIWK